MRISPWSSWVGGQKSTMYCILDMGAQKNTTISGCLIPPTRARVGKHKQGYVDRLDENEYRDIIGRISLYFFGTSLNRIVTVAY